MTNMKKPTTTRNARIGAFALLLGVVLFSAHAIRSQEDAANGAQARQALKVATDKFKLGDFESAAGYFNAANANRLALTSAEQKDLDNFSSQNTIALKNRQDAVAQLSLAEDALKQGRIQDATMQLKSLQANQFLTRAQTEQVADLNKIVVAKGGAAPKTDAKSLLASGRAALQAGDLAGAENLMQQAEKAGTSMAAWLQPWSDSPAKLKRDIQTAREKAQAPPPVPPVDIAKKLEPQQPEPKKAAPAPSKLGGLWPFGGGSGAKSDPAEQRINDKIAKHMVKDGYIFLQANDLEKAYLLATEAKKLNVAFDPNDPQTPDTLLHEIQRRRGGSPPNPPTPSSPAPKQADAKPQPAAPTDPKAPPADPRAQLRDARTMLGQKKYDEADKLCSQVLASNTRWGLFEDTPEKLRRDIQRQRQSFDRDESVKVLADARKLFTQGNYADAEKKAFIAQKLHGPYGVFDFGDRPQKLLEEIGKAKQAKGISPTPKDELEKSTAQVAKDDPKKAPPLPTIPAGEQLANKNRAIVVVREAMELERLGRFWEARQKALEAKALKAAFGPDEQSPDAVIFRLNAKGEQQIQMHLQQATEIIVNAGDPQRFEKAKGQLTVARQIAQAFELDTSHIDQKTLQFHKIYTGTQPITTASATGLPAVDPLRSAPIVKVPIPTGDPQKDELRKLAREKLQHAQVEFTHGNLTQARRMAEELFRADPELAPEVSRLIQTISAEEYNLQVLSAKRNFDVGLEAFARKDYRKALAMFQAIDPNMLPEQHKMRLRDIIATREMQPTQIAQVGGQELLQGSPIIPKGEPGGKPDAEPRQTNLMQEFEAKQQVHYQMVRQRGQDALKSAHDQFRNGQKDQAIKTLEGYIEQIGMTGFDPLRVNELKRPAEARIQQYRTVMAREKFNEIDADSKKNFAMYHDEAATQRSKRKHHQEVFEKMKVVQELYKQNKFKEAQVEVKKIRAIDPDNPAALAYDNMINTRLKQDNYDKDVLRDNESHLNLLAGGMGKIPENGSAMMMDKDIAARRAKGDNNGSIQYELKHPKERAIEYRLRQPISLNFKDKPLQEAINDIGMLAGIPVLPDRRALQEARISLDAPLTESIPDVEMRSALNILLKPLRLTFVIEDQVLKITTEDNRIRMRRITYPVGDLIVAVEDHPLPDVFNVQKMIEHQLRVSQPYYGQNAQMAFPMNAGTPVSSHSQGNGSLFGSQTPGQAPTPQNKEKTKEAMAEMLKTLIQEIVAKNSWEGMGGQGAIQYFPQGMALVVNQQQEVQEEIGQLLAALRKLQDLQVTVEMRAVVVSETFFERIGLDFDMNIRTPTSRAEPTLLSGAFVPAPFNNRNLDRLGGLISGLTSAGTLTPDLNIPVRNSTFNFTTPQFGGYQPEAGLSLGLAFLSDIQVFMFLEAVQGDRRAHIMQAPRITLFNGQTGFINGQVQRPIFSGFVPITLPTGAIVMSAINTPFPFGMGMQVQPVVSPDRRFIRLNVQPQFGSPLIDTAAATVLVQSGAVAGTLDSGVAPPLPNGPLSVQVQPTSVNLVTSNTTVNVPDGGTVVLGGFRFLAEERTEYGPPILSKIPYLSRLFRNVGWSRDGGTLIFLVTARIISIEEEEQILLGNIDPIPR